MTPGPAHSAAGEPLPIRMTSPDGSSLDLTRRDVLKATSAAAAASLAAPALASAPIRTAMEEDEPWFRISLAEWSLHKTLWKSKDDGGITNLEFPAVARGRFGVEGIEYVNSFFKSKDAKGNDVGRGTDFGYLSDLRAACSEAGVESLIVMVDGEGQLADEDDGKRRDAVENHFKWLAAAAFLGCHSIRVNAGGGGTPEAQAERAADSLLRIARVGADYDVNVIVENHGGLSSDGAWLSGVMKRCNHERVGTLPDFGNFYEYDRYQGVTDLMPFAKAVSAKSHDFDEKGDETKTDYRRMLQIVKDAGYRGWVGIEYEGGRLSEDDGILATKKLLERVRAELA